MTFVQNSRDKSIVKLTFKQSFLRAREELVTLDQKDISGVVSFYEPLSGRVFDSYTVKVHANTAPPSILNPCFQLTSSGTDGEYIICFYMPKFEADQIHKDTYNFFVNNQHLYIDGTSSSDRNIYQTRDDSGASVSYQDRDTRFTTSVPSEIASTITSLEPGGFEFDPAECPEGYIPMYFMTGLAPTTNTTNYTFKIQDDDGLSNSISISNKSKQLNPPSYSVVNNQTCLADEDTGLYTIYITHDGLCTDGTSCGSGVSFNYTITEVDGQNVFLGGTSSVKTGTATGRAVIQLPRGNYSISSTAFKNYYITSDSSDVTGVGIRQAAIFYVREDGDNDANGSRATPYRTIQKAIHEFKQGKTSGMYDADSACEIRVLSDLTPPAEHDFTMNADSFVEVSGVHLTNQIIIKGYGGQYAIDANRSESSLGHVMYIAGNCNVTLNNLIIKGGYTCGDHSSSEYDGAGIQNYGSLIATDCIIEHNTALNTNEGGGGIWNASSGKLNLTRCILRYNTNDKYEDSIDDLSDYCGSAIHSDGSTNDSCVLTDCTITHNTGGPAIDAARIFMTGGSVTYNISKNTTECAGIEFRSGTLDGVDISYNEFSEIIPVSDRGYSGGGIWVSGYGEDGTESIIKNCTIKNNKACFGAGIYIFEASDSDVIIENSTITGNTSYRPANEIEIGAGVFANYDFTLKGKNTIYNNYLSDGATQSNVYLVGDNKINIFNNISGSQIGISKIYDSTTIYKPVAGTPNNFTTNYGYPTKNSKKPQEIFKSENGYGITDNAGEGAFAVSSATNINPLNYTFKPVLESGQIIIMRVYPGASKNFTLSPCVGTRLEADGSTKTSLFYNPADKKLYASSGYSNPDPSDSQLKITAVLYSGSVKVKNLSINDLDITLKATIGDTTKALPEGNYIIKIYAEFLGIKQETSIPVTIDYSADTVVDYISSLTRAGTYDVIVKGTLGPDMVGSSSRNHLSSSDQELARITKTIYSRPSNVLINLDARETSCIYSSDPLYPLLNYNNAYFRDCYPLKSIKMPAWLDVIFTNFFNSCSNLTSVEIPSSVTSIAPGAFQHCSSLSTIKFGGTKEQWKSIEFISGWREGVTSTDHIICSDGNVPFGFLELYDMRGSASADTAASECKTALAGSGTSSDPYVVDGETNKIIFKFRSDETVTSSPALQEGLSYSYDSQQKLGIITIDRSGLTIADNGLSRTINFVNKVFYFKLMPEPVDTVGYSIPLTIEARVANTSVSFNNKASGPVYYKINDGDEVSIQTNTNPTILLNEVGDKVSFYGNNTTYASQNSNSKISCDNQCYVYGNVMSLINKNGFRNAKTLQEAYALKKLFLGNNYIDISPEHNLLLPATTLSEYCYDSMFSGCSVLTKAPVLPAKTMADHCYQSMFKSCTGLSQAPVLPATSLAENCYTDMFYGCIKLTTAPALPATTLARGCYSYMFYGCSKLVDAPALPATSLTEYCYNYMFTGCSQLATVPRLPATTLAISCYDYMFKGCTELVDASNVFAGVNHTTLAEACCSHMFDGCTKLTNPPSLSAISLANQCYLSMFAGCTALVDASNVFTNERHNLAQSCCQNMFEGCISLTEAPPLASTSLAVQCYMGMFRGCTSLVTAPMLPANRLISKCYEEMFKGCRGLTSIICLSTTEITPDNQDSYTKDWVKDVTTSSSCIFKTHQNMTLYTWRNYSPSTIPQNWTVQQYTP